MRNLTITLIVLSQLTLLGCQSMKSMRSPLELVDIPSGIPWKAKPKAGRGQPVRLVATWTDTVLNTAGQPSQRGFGGKIFFYGKKDAMPVIAKGQLVIYAFKEDGRLPTDSQPNRRYVFPPEQLASHMSEDELGPSYSFWLPWDEAGGEQCEVSLIARFEPITGAEMVVSDQTKHRLPGRIAPETMLAQPAKPTSAVQQASFAKDEAPKQPALPKRQLETKSIALPGAR